MKEIKNILKKIEGIYNNTSSFFNTLNKKDFNYIIVNYYIDLPFLLYKICDGEIDIIKRFRQDLKTSQSVLQLYNEHLNLKTNTYKKAVKISQDMELVKNYLYDIDSIILNEINSNQQIDKELAKKLLKLSKIMEYNYTNDVNEYILNSLNNNSPEDNQTELSKAFEILLN